MNIFVGNLLFEASEADVKKLFEGFGSVASVTIVMEKKGIKSRGFGFVEMLDDGHARLAISALDGKDFMGRILNVSPAHPKKDKIIHEKNNSKINVKPAAKDYPGKFVSRPGKYMGGRRTRSYIMKHTAEGGQGQYKPRSKHSNNPMRWLKKRSRPEPWEKSKGVQKPSGRNSGRKGKPRVNRLKIRGEKHV